MATGHNSFPPGVFLNLAQTTGQPNAELARRAADLQERQLEHQAEMLRQDLELRREAQKVGLELQRLALDRADENEKAQQSRLDRVADSKINFADRGQTFAMWLAGGTTVVLVAAGLVCIFLTVAGVIPGTVGLAAATILLAAGLFASISNLVKHFLPGGSGGDDEAPKG
jgi:hypothetical protein